MNDESFADEDNINTVMELNVTDLRRCELEYFFTLYYV